MSLRRAFTMIELIFVIVIMGIIGKFGTEFLAQAYNGFIFSNINNTLQSNSATTVEFIASRLQHRIKDSVIVRTGPVASFEALASADTATEYLVMEWVAADVDGFRGTTSPYWSGIIDLEHPDATSTLLISPETNVTAVSDLISILSHGDSDVNESALYFIGSNSDVNGYGWDANVSAFASQNNVMHPIKSGANEDEFVPRNSVDGSTNSFTGIDVYEYYKLAWTANAIVMEDFNATSKMGNLVFYYDYQPWNGERFYDNGVKNFTIMQDVSTFQAMAIGSIIKIQVCAKSNLLKDQDGDYSLCKEKTIF